MSVVIIRVVLAAGALVFVGVSAWFAARKFERGGFAHEENAAPKTGSSTDSLQNAPITEYTEGCGRILCNVCLVNVANIVSNPCKHLCVCPVCAERLVNASYSTSVGEPKKIADEDARNNDCEYRGKCTLCAQQDTLYTCVSSYAGKDEVHSFGTNAKCSLEHLEKEHGIIMLKPDFEHEVKHDLKDSRDLYIQACIERGTGYNMFRDHRIANYLQEKLAPEYVRKRVTFLASKSCH